MSAIKNTIRVLFKEIIEEYNLNLEEMDDSQIFLVGNGFALSVGSSLEGIIVLYVVPKEKKTGLSVYHITNLLQDRFTEGDRKKYGTPITHEEHIEAQLRVLASGLFNWWSDLLSGKKGWLKNSQLDELSANQPTINIMLPIFQNQTKNKQNR